jgi:PhzF family phenazine biosynthesis protein
MAPDLVTVDAFTQLPFTGNPAAVCLPGEPVPGSWMQRVAAEANLSETAFVWPAEGEADRRLRWFTPEQEVDLCGHATLAAAHVLFERGVADPDEGVVFATNADELACRREAGQVRMRFPREAPTEQPGLAGPVEAAVGVEPSWVGASERDAVAVLDEETAVRALSPDLDAVADLDGRGLIATARSDDDSHVDFVSRFFAPAAGVPEDPVTGSAHCALGPYWADELGEDELVGRQVSARGGTVRVEVVGDEVELAGHAVTVVEGELGDAAAPP